MTEQTQREGLRTIYTRRNDARQDPRCSGVHIQVDVEPALVCGEIVLLEFTEGTSHVGRVFDATHRFPTVEFLMRSDDPLLPLLGQHWEPSFPWRTVRDCVFCAAWSASSVDGIVEACEKTTWLPGDWHMLVNGLRHELALLTTSFGWGAEWRNFHASWATTLQVQFEQLPSPIHGYEAIDLICSPNGDPGDWDAWWRSFNAPDGHCPPEFFAATILIARDIIGRTALDHVCARLATSSERGRPISALEQ